MQCYRSIQCPTLTTGEKNWETMKLNIPLRFVYENFEQQLYTIVVFAIFNIFHYLLGPEPIVSQEESKCFFADFDQHIKDFYWADSTDDHAIKYAFFMGRRTQVWSLLSAFVNLVINSYGVECD